MQVIVSDLTKPNVCECGETHNLSFGADPVLVKTNKNFSPRWICPKCLEQKNEEVKKAA